MRFKPKSIVVLKRETPKGKIWRLVRTKNIFHGLYTAWRACFKAIEDKEHIVQVRVEIIRKK